MKRSFICLSGLVLLLAGGVRAQRQDAQSVRDNASSYHVTMIPRTILAINYQNRTKTEIGFQGSPLMPLGKGEADVESKNGRIAIDAEFKNLEPASKFGPEYLTYVLWGITPEGKANNLGEVLLSGDKSKLKVTTTLQTFGLIVTAEPYYAVSQPSDVVVLENSVVPGTSGTLQQVNVNYRLFKRGVYSYNVEAATKSYSKSKVPLEVEEARNAVQIAENTGAQQYAPETLTKATQSLTNAEMMLKKGDNKVIVQNARDAVQNAAEAVQQTMQRKEEEALAQERAASAQQTAAAQAEAQASAARQQQEAAARQQSDLQRQQAELESQKAAAAQQEAELRAQQEAQARSQAEMQSQRDAQAAAQAQQAAAQAEAEKQQLRAALLEQFNRILPTTDTPRGLKANLADVLFATGKYELQPNAREALAKFSGIVIGHPGLKIQVEGYTDNVGGDTLNQTLSENRANSVRAYLIAQGIDPTSVTAVGYGKSNPVESNDNSAGRQQNRRVELIISGEIIGTQIGGGQQRPSDQMPSNQMPQQAPR
jgi:outer membrane protein OmpA-like peptidoglycan-associated protein